MGRDIIGLLVIAALGAWGGWEACNRYGSSARQLARYNTEIAAANKRLQEFESEEKRLQIAAEDRAAAEDASFATTLPKLDKCLLTPAQAAALNRIGGEP